MTANSRDQLPRRMEWFVEILARLRDRGVDMAAVPLSPETVRAVVTVSDEIMNEELVAAGLEPMAEAGDGSDETFELLEEYELPAGGLARVEMIIEANEAVAFRDFLESTASGAATTWDEYMNRGNARGTLGRIAEAFEDYAAAAQLARRPRDRSLVARNKRNLLLRLAESTEGDEQH